MTSQKFQHSSFDRNFINSHVESSFESESMEEDVLKRDIQAKRRQNVLNRGEKLVSCACQSFERLDDALHHVSRWIW